MDQLTKSIRTLLRWNVVEQHLPKLYKEGVVKGLIGEVLSIQEVAKLDSKDLKLLMGQLRYLFNERPESSRDPIVQESCLQSAIH